MNIFKLYDPKNYDSKAEVKFHLRHPTLYYNKDNKVLRNANKKVVKVEDENGHKAAIAFDFSDYTTETMIEFKSGDLNLHTNMRDCEAALEKTTAWIPFNTKLSAYTKQSLYSKANVEHGWNHSLKKQQLSQELATSLGKESLLVFADDAKVSEETQHELTKQGVNWCWEFMMNPILNQSYLIGVGDDDNYETYAEFVKAKGEKATIGFMEALEKSEWK
ncbi:hypothetical protein [Vibrio lentus]|uniref:hypothetical protein n=1 Tax=Vibrio lentus TaxID=136468 RepID=UPI00097665D4|nr:hypothetical protein [Vibrio lentus]OMO20325.1 hypothetical protein BH583_13215 [Vibrio lentus]PMN11083.1 hypothetical protein BCT38_04635 [Vibrio lentus]